MFHVPTHVRLPNPILGAAAAASLLTQYSAYRKRSRKQMRSFRRSIFFVTYTQSRNTRSRFEIPLFFPPKAFSKIIITTLSFVGLWGERLRRRNSKFSNACLFPHIIQSVRVSNSSSYFLLRSLHMRETAVRVGEINC